jgi:hypothetical protein
LIGISILCCWFFVAFIIAVKVVSMTMIIHPRSECCLMMKSKNKKRNTNNKRKTNLIMEMQFYYDNKIVKNFIYATIFWCSNVYRLCLQCFFPNLTDQISWLSYGLRPYIPMQLFCLWEMLFFYVLFYATIAKSENV